MTQAEQAYADGFWAGQQTYSTNNSWSMSAYMDDYVRGFDAGGKTYLAKLRLGRLTNADRILINWQREHMDVFENAEFRDPTDEDAAGILDELDAEQRSKTC
jgi:hypothetical protein